MTETIKKSVLDIFEGADERDWPKVQGAMAEKVLLDYTSMTGGEPSLLTPADITQAWAGFLPGFDRTKHNLSNFTLHTKDDRTVVTFEGKADHFIDDKVWIVEGDYSLEMQQDHKVNALKFNFKSQSGDTNLPQEATARVSKNAL